MPEISDDAKTGWRSMRHHDLAAVLAIADRVHPAFPEEATVFEERMRLYPQGCLVHDDGRGTKDAIAAYVVSHPWHAQNPPALNASLGELPDVPSTYYLHDIALLPALRGTGAASIAVNILVTQARAEKLTTLSLVAVNGSGGFWQRHGFELIADAGLAHLLQSYDAEAAFMVLRL